MGSIDHTAAIHKAGLTGAQKMLVDGALCEASDGATFPATDPATGLELARIPKASAGDVDRAVVAARKAYDGEWSALDPERRARLIRALGEACREHRGPLAFIESLDVGMPRTFAKKLSVGALAKNLTYYAGWADKLYGDVVPTGSTKTLDFTRREPFGVVVAITPWNTPALAIGSKLGPALAAGNAVILKPSERASLTACRVAELALEVGFPAGAVQIVTGDGETGRALVEHPGTDLISFTGGGGIAQQILGSTARRLKPSLLELGGKSPNIIFADANLTKATMLSTMGVFGLTGQACAAGTRLLVERPVYESMLKRVIGMAKGLKIGDPVDGSTMIGPLISGGQRDRVQSFIEAGRAEGARLALEGRTPSKVADAGFFIGPHVFAEVTPEMSVWRDEIFGPVLCVTPFDTEREAVALANDTEYGLAAGVWTADLARAHRVANGVRAGTVWVNTYGMLPTQAPFGGFKKSGWGREGGRQALDGYTQVKNVLVDIQ